MTIPKRERKDILYLNYLCMANIQLKIQVMMCVWGQQISETSFWKTASRLLCLDGIFLFFNFNYQIELGMLSFLGFT